MASTDARPIPRKNVAYRLYFAVRKSDGSLITSWTGQDSEVSLDGAAFSDCTNEATEIGTSGCGYIDFTSSEMNADSVVYKLTVTNTGALTTVVTLFPEEAGDMRTDTVQISGDTTAADNCELMFDGTGYAGGTTKFGVDVVALSGDATAADNAEAFFDGTGYAGTGNTIPTVTTVTNLTNAPTNGDLTATMKTSVTTAATAATPTAAAVTGAVGSVTGAVGSVTGNVGGNVTGSVGSVTGNVGGNVTGSVGSVAAGGITAASIATGAIDADALAADAVAEIADGLWDEALSGHLTAGSTGNALNAAGSAGDPWSTSLPGAYGAGSAGKILGDNLNATVSSRASQTSVDTVDDFLDTEIAAIKAKTDGLNFTGTDVKATLDSETVTVGTNNDKTGYTLTSGPLDAAGVRTAIGLAAANLDTQLAAIVADTNELQTDWVNGGRLDLLIDDLVAKLLCVKAAVYDSASVTGDVITLSNGATQTIGADGDRTTA